MLFFRIFETIKSRCLLKEMQKKETDNSREKISFDQTISI